MQPGDRDELLSAYLDREVTPAERAVVEARLDTSPDSRAELDALAELSLCLRTFDRPTAPPELKSSVMQALAGRTIANVPVPADKPRRKHRREWMISIAAVVTSACGLFLAISNMNFSQQNFRFTPHVTTTTNATGTVDAVAETTPASFDALRPTGKPVDHRLMTLHDAEDLVKFNLSASATPMPMAAKPSDGTLALEAEAKVSEGMEAKERSGNPLDKVALNQFLEMWASTDAPDRYVANIDLQVLDVKKAADVFQVVLKKNGVGGANKAEMADASATTELKSGQEKQSSDGSMIVIYVDSTADRVTKSLEELAQRHDVLDVNLRTPLALARMAENNGGEVRQELSESLQRAELDVVTNAYIAQNWMDLNSNGADDFDAPADALDALFSLGTEVASDAPVARKQQAPNTAFKKMPVARGPFNRGMDSKDAPESKIQALSNSLNYQSVVNLPIPNNFDKAAGNTPGPIPGNEALNNAPQLSRYADGQQAKALSQRNGVLLNESTNREYAEARNRAFYSRDANNGPVRVLVVFQDAPALLKAKADAKPAP